LTKGTVAATGIITNDDTAPVFSIANASATEGGQISFTVTRTGDAQASQTVEYATAFGTAGASDFTAATGILTFAQGETSKPFTVQTTADNIFEGDENFTVNLSNVTGGATISSTNGSATGTITDDDALPTVSIAVLPSSVKEDPSQQLVFTISLDRPNAFDVSVTYSLGGGQNEATEGVDYTVTPTGKTVTIAAGQTSTQITVRPVQDTVFENAEPVTVTLQSATDSNNQAIAISQTAGVAAGTINDNTGIPEASLSVDRTSVAENGGIAFIFTVTLNETSTAPTTVNYTLTGTATAGTDYSPQAVTGSVTIAAGQTTNSFTVTPTDDNLFEGSESIIATLVDGTTNGQAIYINSANHIVAVDITDDEIAPVFSVTDAGATEGGQIIFTVTRTGDAQATQTVDYATAIGAGDTASPNDFTGANGTLTFTQGETTKTFVVQTTTDNIFEGDETFSVSLSNATGGATISSANGSATGTITDNGTIPVASISESPRTVAEDGTTNMGFTVTLDKPSASDTVVNFTLGGTATEGTDYAAVTNKSVTIAAGQTSISFSIDPTADTIYEDNETVIATLATGTGYTLTGSSSTTATGTISNDDNVPSIAITTTPSAVNEDSSTNIDVTFTIDKASAFETVIEYVLKGTATEGTDYAPLANKTLSIPAGSTSITITIDPTADNNFESDETVIVEIVRAATNGQNLSQTNHSVTATITNNDALPTASLAVAPASVAENGSAGLVYTVTLDKASAFDTTINYTLGGTATAGTDYQNQTLTGTLTIQAGRTSQSFTVNPINDNLFEGAETVIAKLINGTTNNIPIIISSTNGEATGSINDNDAATPPTVSIAVAPSNIQEKSSKGQLVYTITLDKASAFATTVDLDITGTATEGTDYKTVNKQVTIAAGQTSTSFAVRAINDNISEGQETVIATITGGTTNGQNLLISGTNGSATGIIDDNDGVPEASIAVSPQAIDEDGNVGLVYTITLSEPSAFDTVVNYILSGTATNGVDYPTQSGTLTIAAGSTTNSFTITPNDDSLFEGNETVIATLDSGITNGQNITIGTASATGTINDDDALTAPVASISVTPSTVAENGSAGLVYTVTLDKASAFDTTVDVTLGGTATEGTDYGSITKQITIAAGSTSKTFIVSPINDNLFEGSETVIATLSSGSTNNVPITVSSTNGSATGTITDDNALTPPTVSITVAPSNIQEKSSKGQLIYTITLDKASAFATIVDLDITGTATEGTDYKTVNKQVAIAAGQTSTSFAVRAINDNISEGQETIIATITGGTTNGQNLLISGTNGSATGIIDDNDGVPEASIAVSPQAVDENGTVGLVYTVTLSEPSAFDTVVNYTLSGTATNGVDYPTQGGTLTIAAGSTTNSFTVTPTNDNLFEGNETVIATLTGGTTQLLDTNNNPVSTNITIGTATATGTINDDDAVTAPTGAIAVNPTAVDENGNAGLVYTVTLDKPSAFDTTLDVILTGTATEGSDYQLVAKQVTIQAGTTSKTFTVNPINDNLFEGNETVIATLTGGTTNSVPVTIGTATAIGNINDDDAATPPTVSITVAPSNIQEKSSKGQLVYTITLDKASAFATIVDLDITGTATEGTDYKTVNKQVTIAAGQTSTSFAVRAINDNISEGQETVIATITGGTTNGQNLLISGTNGSATGIIDDNDGVPEASIAVSPQAVDENGTVGLVYTITLSEPSAFDTVVNYTLSGTATAGTDYPTQSGTLTIAAGSTTNFFIVTPTDDNLFEGSETVIATLTGGTTQIRDANNNPVTTNITIGTATATGTINDDDAVTAPTAAIAVNPTVVDENGNAGLVYTVTLDKPSAFDTTLDVILTGTATEGSDYQLVAKQVTIQAGSTSKTFTVNPNNDNLFEGAETVIATLSSGSTNNTPITISSTNGSATGTINDDEAAFSLRITPATVGQVTEGNAGETVLRFTVSRQGELTQAIQVPWFIDNTGITDPASATDFVNNLLPSGFVDFGIGENSKEIVIQVKGDTYLEADENFQIRIQSPNSQIAVPQPTAIGTIINDDSTPPVSATAIAPTPAQLLSFSGPNGTPSNGPVNLLFTLEEQDAFFVNEIGILIVDDEQGRVDGLLPSDPGYTQAALARSKVVFSALGVNGFNDLDQSRILQFFGTDQLQLFLVQNGTVDSFLAGNGGTVFFGTPNANIDGFNHFGIGTIGQDKLEFSLEDLVGGGDQDFNDLKLTVEITQQGPVLGSELQGQNQDELLDFRNNNSVLNLSLEIWRDAAFNHQVGLYEVANSLGQVYDQLGNLVNPGDANYTQVALSRSVFSIDSFNTQNGNKTVSTTQLTGGSILAPFLISDGTVAEAMQGLKTALFPFLGANPGQKDYVRLLGDNTFAFEDFPIGGDFDYNDLVVRFNSYSG
ncbi:DUF4114 domain-containing protein, partial [Synechocystis salina LEGE 06155]|nr:DUF4114 domain-containing protein [Synechocystis salina LEGE 06155]